MALPRSISGGSVPGTGLLLWPFPRVAPVSRTAANRAVNESARLLRRFTPIFPFLPTSASLSHARGTFSRFARRAAIHTESKSAGCIYSQHALAKLLEPQALP